MARVRRVQRQTVSRSTIRRRGRQAEALAAERTEKSLATKRRQEAPETLGQARVWQRKNGRYLIAGLCYTCAAQAAWGHAQGFEKIKPPCDECLPVVRIFPTPGPKGSPWKKILDKLEYMSESELSEWLDSRA